jgi:hypothetical protein
MGGFTAMPLPMAGAAQTEQARRVVAGGVAVDVMDGGGRGPAVPASPMVAGQDLGAAAFPVAPAAPRPRLAPVPTVGQAGGAQGLALNGVAGAVGGQAGAEHPVRMHERPPKGPLADHNQP